MSKADDEALARLRGWQRTDSAGPSGFFRDTLGRVGVGQGLLMGYGDEAFAYGRSVLGENYDEALADERAKVARSREDRPWASTAAEIAGGIAPAAGALLATPATGGAAAPVAATALGRLLASPITRSAAAGLAQGAAQGFGEGEGGLGNRLDRAGEGALVGGGVGAVAGSVVPAVRALRNRGTGTAADRAADSAARHIEADGRTPNQIATEYADRQATLGAKPETLADVYPGSNVAGAYDAALNRSADGREAAANVLMQRQADAPGRVVADFETAAGQPRRYDEVVQQAYTDRRINASPLYDRARAHGEVNDPAITQQLLRLDPEVLRESERWARRAGTDPAPLVTHGDAGAQLARTPTVTDLDHVKRSLDELVERNTDGTTGRVNQTGMWAAQQRAALLGRLDDIVVDPATGERTYAAARAAYAGPSGVIDAADLGRRAFRLRPEEITRELRGMSPDARQGFLSGLVDATRTRVGRVPEGNDAAVVGVSTNDRDVLRAAIRGVHANPADADRIVDGLIENMRRERQMARTKGQTLQNSATARRQDFAEGERNGNMLAGAVMTDLATGLPGVATGATLAGRWLRNRGAAQAGEAETARSGELLRLLGGSDPAAVAGNMAEIEARRQAVERMRREVWRGNMGRRGNAVVGGATAAGVDQSGPADPWDWRGR